MQGDAFSGTLSMVFSQAETAAAPRRKTATEKEELVREDTGKKALDGMWDDEAPTPPSAPLPPAQAARRGGFDRDEPVLVGAAAVVVQRHDKPGLVSALRRRLPRLRACIPREQLQDGHSHRREGEALGGWSGAWGAPFRWPRAVAECGRLCGGGADQCAVAARRRGAGGVGAAAIRWIGRVVMLKQGGAAKRPRVIAVAGNMGARQVEFGGVATPAIRHDAVF